jgi:hypothetical protein
MRWLLYCLMILFFAGCAAPAVVTEQSEMPSATAPSTTAPPPAPQPTSSPVTDLALGDGRVMIQYPSFWELETQLEDRAGFLVGASEILVFHYYLFDPSVAQLIELKESKSVRWRFARQRMENYAQEWAISQEWEIVEENPIGIQMVGQQSAICQEVVLRAELSKTRLMRSLTCEFDCSEYICGINYIHFGDDAFTLNEWETVSQFADSVKVD